MLENLNVTQIIVTFLLSSGFVTGVFALINKKTRSPESQNELSRIGNEFARQLLLDAKAERDELRLTIRELEASNAAKQETINRLNELLAKKDASIRELEQRAFTLAVKIRRGDEIHMRDIFGPHIPEEFDFTHP